MQKITDEELQGAYYFWLEHYTIHGDKHYTDTPEWRIEEIYFDKIVDRILQDLPEMDDEDEEALIEKIRNI